MFYHFLKTVNLIQDNLKTLLCLYFYFTFTKNKHKNCKLTEKYKLNLFKKDIWPNKSKNKKNP